MNFVWTTFSNDGACCIESVKAVLGLGVEPAKCIVGEHVGKELSEPDREVLDELGVKRTVSLYTRRNLYTDKVGRLDLLYRNVDSDDWVFNLDSDTILNSLDPVAEAMDGDFVAMAGAWPGCLFAGCACMFRRDALKTIIHDLRTANTLKFPGQGIADDRAAGMLLDHFYGPEKVLRRTSGYVTGWHFGEDTRTFDKLLDDFSAVTFGQKCAASRLALGRPVRDVVAEHMRQFRKWRNARWAAKNRSSPQFVAHLASGGKHAAG